MAARELKVTFIWDADTGIRKIEETERAMGRVETKTREIGKATQIFGSGGDVVRSFDASKKATEGFEGAVKQAKGAIDLKNFAMGALIRTFGGFLSAAGIIGATRQTMTWASELTALSRQTGLTTGEIQRLSFAAQQNNGDIRQVVSAIGMMQVQLSSGDKGVIAMLGKLGLNFDEIRNQRPAEQFAAIATAIGLVEDPALRAEAATAVFGRTGRELLPIITGNFKDLMDQAPVTADVSVRALDEIGNAISALWQKVKSVGPGVLGFFASLLNPFSMENNRTVQWFESLTGMVPAGTTVNMPGAPGSPDRGVGDALPTLGIPADIAEIEQRLTPTLRAAKTAAQEVRDTFGEWYGRIKAASDEMFRMNGIVGSGLDALSGGVQTPFGRLQIAGQNSPTFVNGKLRTGVLIDGHEPRPTSGLDFLPGTALGPEPAPGSGGGLLSGFGDLFKSGAVSQTILGALMGGGNVSKSVGGLFGGQLGSHFGEKAVSKFGEGSLLGGILGSALPILGTIGGSLLGGAVNKLFKTEGKQVNNMRDEFIAAAGGLHELNVKAVEAGTSLDKLLAAKKVKDFESAVQELQGKIGEFSSKTEADQLRLNAALDRYGISWEQAGEKFRQSRIDALSKELIEDWRVLTQVGGVDVVVAADAMKDHVNEFLATALRTGSEVPAAMRPMLQQMADMGLLTDESGQALKDLSSIPFAETMTEGFRGIKEVLVDIKDVLRQGFPQAMATAAGAARDFARDANEAFSTIDIPAIQEGDNIGQHGGGDYAHTGGYVGMGRILRFHQGGDVPAMLQPGEFVVNRRGVDALHRLNQGEVSGGTVVVQVDAKGAFFQDERSLDRLADKISRKIAERASPNMKFRIA